MHERGAYPRRGRRLPLVHLDLTVFDVIGLGIAGVMIVLLVGRAAMDLRELAKQGPAASRR